MNVEIGVSGLAKVLESRGIRMSISGCGCCESPRVKVEVDGKEIFDGENVDLEMFLVTGKEAGMA